MEKKVPITNKVNYNEGKPSLNKFIWFRLGDEIYNRFRNKNDGPYSGEMFYNTLRNEFEFSPNTAEENWTDKEGFYSLISAGTYECDDEGFIYFKGNGNPKLNPKEEHAKEFSRKTGLEFRIKE